MKMVMYLNSVMEELHFGEVQARVFPRVTYILDDLYHPSNAVAY